MSTIPLLLVLALTAATGVLAQSGGNCKVMTAAIEHGRTVLAFYGPQYVMFDVLDKREVKSEHAASLYGRHLSVNAVYHPLNDPETTIVISGRYYFKRKGNSRGTLTRLSNLFTNRPYFNDRIGAATSHMGYALIFRGCYMLARNDNGDRVFNIRSSLGLPCGINAAWTQGHYVYVSKGSQIYRFADFRNKATEIKCNDNSEIWPMCKCRET